MNFRAETDIGLLPAHVFEYLRDLDKQPRDPASVVPVFEKTTTGPMGVGSKFHERIRLAPNREADVRSEITRFEPPCHLEFRVTWDVGKQHMDGEFRYVLHSREDGGTHLVREETLTPRGSAKLLAPFIRRSYERSLRQRVEELRKQAEAAPPVVQA